LQGTSRYAYSINRRGQITADGFLDEEPMTQSVANFPDPATGFQVLTILPCRRTHMFVLTPTGH
jgi:hypothetical protein